MDLFGKGLTFNLRLTYMCRFYVHCTINITVSKIYGENVILMFCQ